MSNPTQPLKGEAAAVAFEGERMQDVREWLEIALEASAMGVFDVDLATMQARTNLRHNQIFGYDEPVAEWTPAIFSEHVLPEDVEAFEVAFDRALETGSFDMTVRVRWPDGTVHWIRDWGRIYRDEDGRPVRLVGVTEEVTDAKRAEEELRVAKREAEEASREKSRYLAVMSHELRTPLTGVIGSADLLDAELREGATPRQREALDRIKATAWQLVSIIDDTLALARSETGQEEVRPVEADLAQIVREVVGILGMQAEAKGLEVRLIGAERAVTVRTDEGKARQILMNLVANAVKYTARGEVLVRLDRTGSGEHRVDVRDTGPGIAADDQERIFDLFTRADPAREGLDQGSGLGLAISRRLARLLGGDVTVESTPGVGSTFTLRLPNSAGPEPR